MTHLSPTDKPLVRVITARVPHGVSPKMVVRLFPDGQVSIKELRRRNGEVTFNLATLYVRGLVTRGMA